MQAIQQPVPKHDLESALLNDSTPRRKVIPFPDRIRNSSSYHFSQISPDEEEVILTKDDKKLLFSGKFFIEGLKYRIKVAERDKEGSLFVLVYGNPFSHVLAENLRELTQNLEPRLETLSLIVPREECFSKDYILRLKSEFNRHNWGFYAISIAPEDIFKFYLKNIRTGTTSI